MLSAAPQRAEVATIRSSTLPGRDLGGAHRNQEVDRVRRGRGLAADDRSAGRGRDEQSQPRKPQPRKPQPRKPQVREVGVREVGVPARPEEGARRALTAHPLRRSGRRRRRCRGGRTAPRRRPRRGRSCRRSVRVPPFPKKDRSRREPPSRCRRPARRSRSDGSCQRFAAPDHSCPGSDRTRPGPGRARALSLDGSPSPPPTRTSRRTWPPPGTGDSEGTCSSTRQRPVSGSSAL